MSNPWQALADELAQWQSAGETATLWLRDADAVAATAELDDILEIAAAADVPLALAVIAAGADDGLAARLTETRASTSVLVHGLDHQNKAAAGEKKTELAASRPTAEMKTDLEQARARLQTLFGDRCLPVLVPPWNRISADLVPLLAACGYRGLSTYTARPPDPQTDAGRPAANQQLSCRPDQLESRQGFCRRRRSAVSFDLTFVRPTPKWIKIIGNYRNFDASPRPGRKNPRFFAKIAFLDPRTAHSTLA